MDYGGPWEEIPRSLVVGLFTTGLVLGSAVIVVALEIDRNEPAAAGAAQLSDPKPPPEKPAAVMSGLGLEPGLAGRPQDEPVRHPARRQGRLVHV
ncbi:MAG TPA: hypothetical protein VES39_04205 [Rhodospirillales bacterium]|nr:hypothetical protein [Rhodospirillales bacterium]